VKTHKPQRFLKTSEVLHLQVRYYKKLEKYLALTRVPGSKQEKKKKRKNRIIRKLGNRGFFVFALVRAFLLSQHANVEYIVCDDAGIDSVNAECIFCDDATPELVRMDMKYMNYSHRILCDLSIMCRTNTQYLITDIQYPMPSIHYFI
jgi:hypothetical protein